MKLTWRKREDGGVETDAGFVILGDRFGTASLYAAGGGMAYGLPLHQGTLAECKTAAQRIVDAAEAQQ